MKNCNNKIKQTCGTTNYATCISYESSVNTQSSLPQEGCYDLEETTEDIYEQLEDIRTEINLDELGEKCLTYVPTVEGKTIVKNVLLKHEEEICLLKERIAELEARQLCDFPITDCNLDFMCLADACGGSVTTVGELLQALITKSCENE